MKFTIPFDSIESLVDVAHEAGAPYMRGQCGRVAAYATAFGIQLHLPDSDLVALHRGGLLHDVGNIGIPRPLLLKAKALAPAEYDVVKRHTVIGDALCSGAPGLQEVRPIVRCHHEHLDGSGYPDGLKANSIPLLAQVVSIADAFDALTTPRPYRPALSWDLAWRALQAEADRGWRSLDLVEEFTALARSHRFARVRQSVDDLEGIE